MSSQKLCGLMRTVRAGCACEPHEIVYVRCLPSVCCSCGLSVRLDKTAYGLAGKDWRRAYELHSGNSVAFVAESNRVEKFQTLELCCTMCRDWLIISHPAAGCRHRRYFITWLGYKWVSARAHEPTRRLRPVSRARKRVHGCRSQSTCLSAV